MAEEAPSLGIVGGGVIGSAYRAAYQRNGGTAVVYDTDPTRSSGSLLEALECDVVAICLPTPLLKDGKGLDVSAIDAFFAQHRSYRKPFLLRSTVPVGYTRSAAERFDLANLYHCPEFLTARTAVRDVLDTYFVYVGSADGKSHFPAVHDVLRKLHPLSTAITVPYEVSELAKLATNAFYSTKVTFFNELALLCKGLKVSYYNVRDAMQLCGSIGIDHTLVPGPDGKPGFGGACLPKDLTAYICEFLKLKQFPTLAATAAMVNVAYRDPVQLSSQEPPGASPVEAPLSSTRHGS